ncbi:MAG: antibiotic biosynthesis monooxygenase [Bacteroidia bacterium]|nr:antibiotic biosynthesis monooxygenase [Bacteroidia bacterium]
MITRIVKVSVHDSKIDDFVSFMESVRDHMLAFNGCEHWEVLNDKTNKNIFFSYSIWKSEKELEAYKYSTLYKQIWSTCKQWFTKESQAWTVDNIFDK